MEILQLNIDIQYENDYYNFDIIFNFIGGSIKIQLPKPTFTNYPDMDNIDKVLEILTENTNGTVKIKHFDEIRFQIYDYIRIKVNNTRIMINNNEYNRNKLHEMIIEYKQFILKKL